MRVLLVEDHSAMRFGLRAFLEFVAKMEVVGEAENAGEALRLVEETGPDLVLLDLRLKGKQNGIELCREIKDLPDPPKVLVYTEFNSGKQRTAAMQAGADGFVHKGLDHEQLPRIIRDVCSGEPVWLPGEEEMELQPADLTAEKPLTPRETEVAALVIRGHTNAEIAGKLSISVSTVKSHVRHVLHKLNLENRRALAQKFSSRK